MTMPSRSIIAASTPHRRGGRDHRGQLLRAARPTAGPPPSRSLDVARHHRQRMPARRHLVRAAETSARGGSRARKPRSSSRARPPPRQRERSDGLHPDRDGHTRRARSVSTSTAVPPCVPTAHRRAWRRGRPSRPDADRRSPTSPPTRIEGEAAACGSARPPGPGAAPRTSTRLPWGRRAPPSSGRPPRGRLSTARAASVQRAQGARSDATLAVGS